jgi:hypothetical protein
MTLAFINDVEPKFAAWTIQAALVVAVLAVTAARHRQHARATDLRLCKGCGIPHPPAARFCRRCGRPAVE